MRIIKTREKGYKDYGFYDEQEWKKVIEFCRSPHFAEHDLLRTVVEKVNPEIKNELYDSIVYGVSYDRLMKKHYIPLSKPDFYGYRRKCIEEFWRMLRLLGKWKQ